MTEDLKTWLHQSAVDAILSPTGVKIVGLISALGNAALWVKDNANIIAAVSGILIPWLLYRASVKKTKLEMAILEQTRELNKIKLDEAKRSGETDD